MVGCNIRIASINYIDSNFRYSDLYTTEALHISELYGATYKL